MIRIFDEALLSLYPNLFSSLFWSVTPDLPWPRTDSFTKLLLLILLCNAVVKDVTYVV